MRESAKSTALRYAAVVRARSSNMPHTWLYSRSSMDQPVASPATGCAGCPGGAGGAVGGGGGGAAVCRPGWL